MDKNVLILTSYVVHLHMLTAVASACTHTHKIACYKPCSSATRVALSHHPDVHYFPVTAQHLHDKCLKITGAILGGKI